MEEKQPKYTSQLQSCFHVYVKQPLLWYIISNICFSGGFLLQEQSTGKYIRFPAKDKGLRLGNRGTLFNMVKLNTNYTETGPVFLGLITLFDPRQILTDESFQDGFAELLLIKQGGDKTGKECLLSNNQYFVGEGMATPCVNNTLARWMFYIDKYCHLSSNRDCSFPFF